MTSLLKRISGGKIRGVDQSEVADDDVSAGAPPLITASVFGRRDSLLRQASVDRAQNEGIKRRNTLRRRRELIESRAARLSAPLLALLADNAVDVLRRRVLPLATAGNDASEGMAEHIRPVIVFEFKRESRRFISAIMEELTAAQLILMHVESRISKDNSLELDFLVECDGSRYSLLEALNSIAQHSKEEIPLRQIDLAGDKAELLDEAVAPEEAAAESTPLPNSRWFPHHVSELDMCAHVVVKYEPTEDPKHPGYGDAAYIARRAQLNEIANSYKFGDAIPHVDYTAEENATWRAAYTELRKLRVTHTCAEYQENIERMERDGLITAECIPQLRTLSRYIQRRTGFELRPCGGLLSARDFLASLAHRVFQATLYVRHHSRPNHCPEPDVIHEVLGHCPMFADARLAQMSQEIGLLSLGATDEQIERLSTVYWFIIEFGLCRQNGALKAIGAGLISAFGELQHACSDVPRHEPFIPEVTALREYEDVDYQPVYFVAESIGEALDQLRIYARKLCPSHACVYYPLTRSVERLTVGECTRRELDELEATVGRLRRSLTMQ